MRLNEDYFDNISGDDLMDEVKTVASDNNDAAAELCDFKIICSTDLIEDQLDIDSLEKYVARLDRLLEMTNHITAFVKPEIMTVSEFMLKSSGGKFPNEKVRLITNRNNSHKVYTIQRGIFVEFQIRTSFYNVDQSMRFLKSVVNLSKVITIKEQLVTFTKSVYIYPKFVRPDRDYDYIAYMCPARTIERAVEQPTSWTDDIMTPALMLCNRRSDAYRNILDETKMNVFPMSEKKEAASMLGISEISHSNYKSVSLTPSLVKKIKSQFSYTGLKKMNEYCYVQLINAAYSTDDRDYGTLDGMEKYGAERTQEVLSWMQTRETCENVMIKCGRSFIEKPVYLFAWLGWVCVEDAYVTGLNTYNVFFIIKGETETLKQTDEFVSRVCCVFPSTDPEKLKDCLMQKK